ncbi:hypothetical protein ED733_008232 [Metarhizium rileyi]|uniref:Trafficking protein particle complex subunit 11 n=1 Tax=Metarhizium rileyi (strain RCEF 4871) TaxID=1649241 RepID=A0A5C6GLH6_METRR|nr:hypothetical protein ED733_008232 [Metarhizium rileyi]
MDGYPSGSLEHNVPFLVASGLNSAEPELDLEGELSTQGQLVKSDLPPLRNQEAQVLERYFQEIDDKGTSWTVVPREEPYRFRIKMVGRSYLLPPRETLIPDSVEPPGSSTATHSPFSPLSHVSALYPDGLIDSQWIKKHQHLVPSIYACFYSLVDDNRLKSDVHEIKATLARSGFKTRVAIILLGDQDGGTAVLTEEVQERLENIRRGTALDPKSIFYVPSKESPAELKRVIDNILTVLYSIAVEYYRDLGRHARKKRSRGIAPHPTIPPTSGTSHTLSLPDWNFRYDMKTAILAEFRQELDAAIRSFEQAYEILLGQDVLEMIPSWSLRWNEARQLADIISIRCLRLHLWMGHTSLAVRRWQAHRDRIGDFVDRRGHGTNTYGWQAWEARWAMVMAHLMEKVEVPGLTLASMTIFLPPERAVLGERLQPWELLHHTGYWYRMAARHLAARRTLARMMADEDREAPESTPAKSAKSSYDTYMCPSPYQELPLSGEGGVNHAQLIIDCLITSRSQFQARGQLRIAAELSLECAKEMAILGSWDEVVAVLRPVWDGSSYRADDWLDIFEDLCWLLRRAAKETRRADLVLAVDWELMNKKFAKRQHWRYDLSHSLDGMAVEERPSIQLSNASASPLISSSFVFRSKENEAGDQCRAQLGLTSNAIADSVPITLSQVKIAFEGNLNPIVLQHVSSSEEVLFITEVTLEEQFSNEGSDDLASKLSGTCDLTLKPGQKRVFEMAIPLREPGDVEASAVTVTYKHQTFDVEYTTLFEELKQVTGWYIRTSDIPRQLRADARTLHIKPRPPKLQVGVCEPLGQYYTDEIVEFGVNLRNEEDEAANVKLDVRLYGKSVPLFRLQVGEHEFISETGEGEAKALDVPTGTIPSGAVVKWKLVIDPTTVPETYDLHIQATYHLESDSATPITQVSSLPLNIVGPFEANYDLLPRLHPEPWPSLFDCEGLRPVEEGEEAAAPPPANGFAQQWCLMCHYASFASENLTVLGTELQVVSCVGGALCKVIRRPEVASDGIVVSPKTMHEAQFDLVAQKFSLDNRLPITLDLAFAIRWKRKTASADSLANITTMPVGQYLVLGTEPRVLATALYSDPTASTRLLHLDITIENPSNHFLTFGLSMEPSDAFGFSGAKETTINLLPMSRRTTRYRLLPFVQGDYIRPGLAVRDKYFQKVLRIIPTERMKIDKDGLLVWVPGGVDEDAGTEADEG